MATCASNIVPLRTRPPPLRLRPRPRPRLRCPQRTSRHEGAIFSRRRQSLDGRRLPGVSLAQPAPAPAQMGITATTPQSLQVLDSSKTWVPMGVIDPAAHTWSMPISGLVGILPPANGGLGAASLSGLLVGNGASAATAIVPGLGVPAALAATPTGAGALVLATSPQLTGSVGVNTAPNWSNTYIPGSAIQTALIVQGTSTLWNGVLSASRTSQNANASPQNVIADTALAIDDNAAQAQNLWARYTQVGVLNGAATAAQIFGEESSTAWFGSSNAASVDPYNSGSIVDGALFGVRCRRSWLRRRPVYANADGQRLDWDGDGDVPLRHRVARDRLSRDCHGGLDFRF